MPWMSEDQGLVLSLVNLGAYDQAEDLITVYRFTDQQIHEKYSSNRRKALGEGLDLAVLEQELEAYTAERLEDLAKRHTHHSGEVSVPDSPFVSVVLEPKMILKIAEPGAMQSIERQPHLISFKVPPSYLYQPAVASAATKAESEWLYFDFPVSLLECIEVVEPNPAYLGPGAQQLELEQLKAAGKVNRSNWPPR